jgi:hypothetical protein
MPDEKRQSRTRRAVRRIALLGPAAASLLFFAALFLSGRLGVEMARNRLPSKEQKSLTPSGQTLVLGMPSDPVYLARSADSLRRFFASNPSAEARADADLAGLGIRRVYDPVEVSIVGVEADTLEVRVDSGALSGTTHWVHHSQFQAPLAFDPVISPLPLEPRR